MKKMRKSLTNSGDQEQFHNKIREVLLKDNILESELVDLYFDIIDFLNKLFKDTIKYGFENEVHCIYYFNEDKRNELFNNVKERYNFKVLFGKDKESEESLVNNFYESHIMDKFLDMEYEQINQEEYLKVIYENGDKFKNNNIENINEEKKDKLIEEILYISTNKRGYFELSELEFLGCKKCVENLVKEFTRENFFSKVSEDNYILNVGICSSLISISS